MKTVILVESPTKAKTLNRFFKGEYDIEASLGHIRDLPKSNLGVEIEDNFTPKYVIPKEKRKTVESLKKTVKNAKTILLATDPDREGEAIAFHLKEILDTKGKEFKRIVFHEITKEAIEEALTHPRTIDDNLVAAQTARRILDRIVGYKLSPVLWKKVKRKLSAGRVQSIALRLIVEREDEIKKFESKEYFRIFVLLTQKDATTPIEFELISIDGEKIEKSEKLTLYDGEYKYTFNLLAQSHIEEIKKVLDSGSYIVTDVIQKDTKRSPHPPFTTSTLTQESYRRLGYSSKRTMSIAQRLYEEGFITYHRTDSFNLSQSFITSSRSFIEKTFGKEYLSTAPRAYKTKSKMAQEAHEAIRPTSAVDKTTEVTSTLGREYAKLYGLIYKRAVATQMAEAVYASTKVQVESKNEKTYLFETNGRVLQFPGFLKLWYFEEEENMLPPLTKGETLKHTETKITTHNSNPPPRYNEASLISSLEKHGIGRPSTYAPIISTITDRGYIEKIENKFVPTTVGVAVTQFLVLHFPNIDDIPFTSSMEDKLDDVANGTQEWTQLLKEFYGPFAQDIEKVQDVEKIAVEEETTGEKCPECKEGDIVLRRSKFGKFYACNRFPDCTYKKSFQLETEYLCPKDEGRVIMKRTKRGRTFFGCGNYPNCDFAVWKKEDLEVQGAKKIEQTPQKNAENNTETTQSIS
ncbi:MAG TPA: type I DNA topoisomerase [Candidatus Levybacteria bacterium]|nr:type I DNA topoisomerase [Candidatus Levybacteria bacterium]